MGISKRFCMLMTVLLCLLFSVSARAMLPQPGIYEKTDGSGRVTARMFIISLHGKGYTMPGSLTMQTFSGSPIIALQALDADGSVTEELATTYTGKTRTAGAGETGLRLTTDQLRAMHLTPDASGPYEPVSPEIFSTAFGRQVEFSFEEEGKAGAYNCGDALDGLYVKNDGADLPYPVSAVIYAYEKTYNREAFYRTGTAVNQYTRRTDSQNSLHENYWLLNIRKPDTWTHLIAEKNFRVVQESFGQHQFRFLLVDDNYEPAWLSEVWSGFKGSALTDYCVLYLHQFLIRNAPEVVENPDIYVRMTDFYCGEGPNAVTTNALAVFLEENGELMRLGHGPVGDNGVIRFSKNMGRASIKGEGVRLRRQPNTSCAILGEYDTGYPLTVLGFVIETGDQYNFFKWAKVRLDDGTVGYVSGQFIQGLETLEKP